MRIGVDRMIRLPSPPRSDEDPPCSCIGISSLGGLIDHQAASVALLLHNGEAPTNAPSRPAAPFGMSSPARDQC